MREKFAILVLLAFATLGAEAQLLPSRRELFLREEALRNPVGDVDFDALHRRQDTLTLLFIGDVMAHGPMIENAYRMHCKTHPGARKDDPASYDWSAFLRRLEAPVAAADLAVCNMEFPLAGYPYTGYPCFSAPDTYADYLTGLGFDVLLTANNHILDKGQAGLVRTVRACDALESTGRVRYTGISANEADDTARYPLIIDLKGVRIALVNFTYGTNTGPSARWPKVNRMQREDIGKALRRAREQDADYIIVLPHWGIEYRHRHSRTGPTSSSAPIPTSPRTSSTSTASPSSIPSATPFPTSRTPNAASNLRRPSGSSSTGTARPPSTGRRSASSGAPIPARWRIPTPSFPSRNTSRGRKPGGALPTMTAWPGPIKKPSKQPA